MFKKCNFCGKRETPLNPILTSVLDDKNEVSICKICVESASGIFIGDKPKNKTLVDNFKGDTFEILSTFKKPYEIHKLLNEYVVGQESAKIVLVTAIYNHYKRILLKKNNDIDIDKSNIMMIGSSGSGKTYISKKIAEIMDVPIIIADATSLTQTGYIGADVESMLTSLYIKSGKDINKTERGIIFIDEIDKIAKRTEKSGKDSTGEGVQQNLLKILEGTKVQVPPDFIKGPQEQKMIEIDTTNILFIMSGVFDGLVDIIKDRKSDKNVISFDTNIKHNKQNEDWLDDLSTSDLNNYGFLQEFLGRVPITVSLDTLTKKELINIMTSTKNNVISQYSEIFKIDGVVLEFDKNAIDRIAEEAIETNVGARGLKRIIETILTPYMYNIGLKSNIKINKKDVTISMKQKGKDLPKLIQREN